MAISTPPLDIGTYTDVGQIRARNEDSLQIYPEQHPAGQLFVVADGVGGENYGQEASQLAVRRIGELYYQLYEQYPQHPLDTLLREVLMRVNGEVYELALRFGSAGHMGTTAVVAVIRNTTLTVAWVGDSRVYVVSHKKGIARQITVDHSQVEEMVRSGQMSREDAERHPERNVLSRSLGGNPQVDVDSVTGELEQQDLIILCSDGLTRYVEKDLIAQHVLYHPSSQKAAEALGEMANNAGGKDNISIIVIHLGDRSAHNETMVQPDSLPASQVGNLAAVTRQNPNLARRPNRFEFSNPLVMTGIAVIIGLTLLAAFFFIPMLFGGENETESPETEIALTAQQVAETAIAETSTAANEHLTATQRFLSEQGTTTPTATITATPTPLPTTVVPIRQTETTIATMQLETQTAQAHANQTSVAIAIVQTQNAVNSQQTIGVGTILYAQRDTQILFSVYSPSGERLDRGLSVTVGNDPFQGVYTYTFNNQIYYYAQPENSGAGWVLASDLGTTNPNATAVPASNPPDTQVQQPVVIPPNVVPPAAYSIGQELFIDSRPSGNSRVYLQTTAEWSGDQSKPVNHGTEVEIIGIAEFDVLDTATGIGRWWWKVRDVSGQEGYVEEFHLTTTRP